MALILKLYSGLGDSAYLVPVVTQIYKDRTKELYLETPFPEFFKHIGSEIKFLRPNIPYRTQNKMMLPAGDPVWTHELPAEMFEPIPNWIPSPGYPRSYFPQSMLKAGVEVKFHYGADNLTRKNILGIFESQGGIKLPDSLKFNMPSYASELKIDSRVGKKRLPIAVVRPPTDRKEWLTSSRQCNPEYVNIAAEQLRDAGYYVVSVADVKPGEEWLTGPPPFSHLQLHNGELNIKQMMALIETAAVVVGGVGWIVPFSLGYETPLHIIFGGRGGYDNIGNITDMRCNMEKVSYSLPQFFCRCTDPGHPCNKTIYDFSESFAKYLTTLKVRSKCKVPMS